MSLNQGELLDSYFKLARAHLKNGRRENALHTYRKALALAERLPAPDVVIGSIHDSIGNICLTTGNLPAALANYRAELLIALKNSERPELQRRLSVIYMKIGDILREQNRLIESEEHYRSALAHSEAAIRTQPLNLDFQGDAAVAHGKLGSASVAQGNTSAAAVNYQAALSIAEQLAAAESADPSRQVDVARAHWPLLILDAPTERAQRLEFIVRSLGTLKHKNQLPPEGENLLSSAEKILEMAGQVYENSAGATESMRAQDIRPTIWSRLCGFVSRTKKF